MHLKIPPLILTGIFAVLMYVVSWMLPQFTFTFPAKSNIATLIACLGILSCGMGVLSFRQAKTTVNPVQPTQASTLVVSGIYRFSRNPMYLGFLFLLLSWAAFLANIPALLLGPPLFAGYMNKFQILPEEKILCSLFGDDFEIYKNRVRRWI